MAEVNKISLLYTKSPKPSCKDAEKIFEKLTSTLFAVLSTLYKIHNASVGESVVDFISVLDVTDHLGRRELVSIA